MLHFWEYTVTVFSTALFSAAVTEKTQFLLEEVKIQPVEIKAPVHSDQEEYLGKENQTVLKILI